MKMVGKSCKISSTSFVTTIFPVRVPPLYGYHHCAIAKKKAANDSLFSCQGDKSRTTDSSFFYILDTANVLDWPQKKNG